MTLIKHEYIITISTPTNIFLAMFTHFICIGNGEKTNLEAICTDLSSIAFDFNLLVLFSC